MVNVFGRCRCHTEPHRNSTICNSGDLFLRSVAPIITTAYFLGEAMRQFQHTNQPALWLRSHVVCFVIGLFACVCSYDEAAAQTVLFGRELKKEEQAAPNPGPGPRPGPKPGPGPKPTPPVNDGLTAQQRQLFSQIERREMQDFGVAPQQYLQNGPTHAPTPTRLQGGLVVTTGALYQLLRSGEPVITADVLGSPRLIEGTAGTYSVPNYGQGGSFNDYIQQDFVSGLREVTGGNRSIPIVFYCQGTYCWLSYNAALRAIAAGHQSVMWYRGGLESWQAGKLPLVPNAAGQ